MSTPRRVGAHRGARHKSIDPLVKVMVGLHLSQTIALDELSKSMECSVPSLVRSAVGHYLETVRSKEP